MNKKITHKYITEETFIKVNEGISQQFDSVRQQFDGVGKQFDGVHQQFDGVVKQFDGVRQQFEGVDKQFDGVRQQFVEVYKRFDGLDETIHRMALTLIRHEVDIKEIKETMMTKVDGQNILEHLLAFARKYEESERSSRIHLNQIMDFRPKIEDHERRLTILENNPGI